MPQNSDLEQLPYVQAVFKEALRLFPPGHISIREAVEDLNLNGHHIEKGTWLHVSSADWTPLSDTDVVCVLQYMMHCVSSKHHLCRKS